MSAEVQARKELLKYLLMQVKEKELDVDRAKEFIKAIEEAAPAQDEPVAVVGIACRFPGAADKEQYWNNLVAGRESIGDFPEQRVEDMRRVIGGDADVRKGGYLDRIDLFDPEYFGIPPQVAVQLDPYHRILMEVLVETMEDAGYSKPDLHGSTTGIFVGNDHTHRLITSYLPFLAETDFAAVTGSWSGILASRLAYHLNLRGPAAVIDTGCSSGLVALDAAMKAIRQGDCHGAFVGAANLFLSPSNLGNETESGDDRVRAFDVAANGTVWSEGVAGLYVKPLSRAIEDRDHVYGVILSSAVNNDGRSNGLTAPNGQAQKDLLVNAWKRAGISPESLSSIEAHGTGTALGDPIEIKALTAAFAEFTSKRQFCALGSVKTNIGHTVGAAGLASLIKTLLSVERGLIPPSIHFEVPNKYLDLARSPVYVNDRLTEWEPGPTPRRAGVSSFSLSGTNCHVVVQEPPAPAERSATVHRSYLYPISARNEALLATTVARQLAFLDRHPGYRLDDVCFTMQVGREQQPARAVILCESREGLRAGLLRLLHPVIDQVETLPDTRTVVVRVDPYPPAAHTESRAPGTNLSEAAGSSPGIDLPDQFRHLADAVEGYLRDQRRPFESLQRNADVRRVPLPAQQFDRVRLWDETVRPEMGARSQQEELQDPALRVRGFVSEPSRLAGEPNAPAARRVIGSVWSDVLGYPTINGTDDFFALGGDSLSSVKITQLLNAAFELNIPAPTLLGKSVFDEFTESVATEYGLDDERVRARPDRAGPIIEGQPEVVQNYELPLTSSQRSMFLSGKLDDNSVAYNISGMTVRSGPLEVGMLETALRTLVRRHDSLRSSFHMINGEPFQRVHSDVPVAVEHRQLGVLAAGESHESRANEELMRFVRPFRLDEAPLFRFGYFEFDDGVTCIAIDMHHIITDGTSMGNLFSDLAVLADGGTLPPLPRSFRSAIRERIDRLSDAELLPHRNYWVTRFADEVPTLQLPTDLKRPDVASSAGARVFTTIDSELLDAAKRYARDRDITLPMLLLGVFHQVLAKTCAQHDMVIGTAVMGRPDLSYQNLVGMFVNTLALRVAGAPTTLLKDYFAELKVAVLDAFEHQDYPLESLIEELDPPREPGRRPMFDVYFTHQSIDMGQEHDGEQFVLFDDGTAKYDFTLTTREVNGELLMEWEYATALFRRETVELYIQRYRTLLRSMLRAAGEDRLDSLKLISAEESELIRNFSKIDAPEPGPVGVVGLFRRHVDADPDAPALIMGDEVMSYGELDAQANQVAHGLIHRGVTAGSPVALLMDRSFDMIVAILGVLKARCYYVPLNTEFPAERLRMLLDDSAAKVLLITASRAGQAGEHVSDQLTVLDLPACMDPVSDVTDPGLPSHSDDATYLMYTSGTTGAPKGSLIRQRGVLRIAHRASFADADSSDVFLMMSDYSFDGSVYDLFAALTNGASLVIVDRQTALDFDRLGAVIERNRVTRFVITTAMFNALIDIAPDALRSMRRILFGGEIASPVHVKKAFEVLGPGRVAHAYGPTEASVIASVHVLNDFDDNEGVPIGRPINDTSLWVLDENRMPVPIGAVGELYIGGSGLADGYLNLPEVTAERFVTSPAVPGVRLYRSGDLVTLKSNGLFYYNARLDQQVKLRGYRIELAEIMHVALEQPYVRWAHADMVEVAEGSKSLCLWVQSTNGSDPDDAKLLSALQQRLPSYMVPSFILAIDEVRFTKNGKVDTTALPMPQVADDESATRPETDLQQQIATAWSHVLGIAVENIDGNFFALGGDSIKAIQIVAKLKEHQVAVQVVDLLENQTVRLLASAVSEGAGSGSVPYEYDQTPLSGPITAGPIQQEFLDDRDNHARVYTQCLLVTPEEALPTTGLVRGMERLARHHDMLRIEIDHNGGLVLRDVETTGLIHAETAPYDLTEADVPNYLKALQARVDVHGGPVMALTTGLGQERRQFAIAVHHLAIDVVSWGVLLEDLLACVADPDAALAPTSMPFPAWTAELKRYAQEGGFRDQVPYWDGLARRAEVAPGLFTEQRVARGATVTQEIRFEASEATALFDAARQVHGLDPARALVAVVARALAAWTGADQILFTLEGHGREPFAPGQDVSRTVGWFTSAFPHLIAVEEGIEETVDSVRRSFESLPEKGAGYGPLVQFDPRWTRDRASAARIRPQVSFNYLGDQDRRQGGVVIDYLAADITVDDDFRSTHVLDIIASRRDGSVLIEARYPRTWLDSGASEKLAAAVTAAFREVRVAVTGGGTREFEIASPIRQDVLDDILVDLMGGD